MPLKAVMQNYIDAAILCGITLLSRFAPDFARLNLRMYIGEAMHMDGLVLSTRRVQSNLVPVMAGPDYEAVIQAACRTPGTSDDGL
jgi:hypothetical protein